MVEVRKDDRCACGIEAAPPWRGHEPPWSLASVVAGLVLLAIAAVAAGAGLRPWFAPLVLVVYAATTVGALVAVTRAGHRGGCRARRAAWIGLAAIGLPLRLVASLGL